MPVWFLIGILGFVCVAIEFLSMSSSYLVIARKFRPQTFQAVAGQEHITTALANAIVRDRVPHALLFCGPRGVGKTTTARVFAKALNCLERKEVSELQKLSEEEARQAVEPCNECANCVEISKSSSIAVREIDGASNNSVDNVRDLIDSLRTLPPPGTRFKIYIIDEVHMLSTAAFNALLKSLEEPPPNTIFIFATTEPHKIPETVISRCQRHDFRRIATDVIVEQLRGIAAAEGVEVEEGVYWFVARQAQGGLRDAQSMFDRLLSFSRDRIELKSARQVFGVLDQSFYFRLSESILGGNVDQALVCLDEAFQQSLDLRIFVAGFLLHWRNLYFVRLRTERPGDSSETLIRSLEVDDAEFQELEKQVSDVETFDLQRLFEISENVADETLRSNFPRYVLEAGIAKMASQPSLRPLAEILSSLESGASPQKRPTARPKAAQPRGTTPAATEPTPVAVPKPQAVVPEIAPESPSVFNPKWEDFVHFVQSRSEVVLAAHLRRVFAKVFVAGVLELEGAEFDILALKESGVNTRLRECLTAYGESDNWDIRFAATSTQSDEQVETKSATVAAGSVAAKEAKEEAAFVEKRKDEAREDPNVRQALEAFSGSSIERVSVLKEGEKA